MGRGYRWYAGRRRTSAHHPTCSCLWQACPEWHPRQLNPYLWYVRRLPLLLVTDFLCRGQASRNQLKALIPRALDCTVYLHGSHAIYHHAFVTCLNPYQCSQTYEPQPRVKILCCMYVPENIIVRQASDSCLLS